MPICLDCSVDFPWLEDEDRVCNKCLELRDKSEIDKASIRVRIIYSSLPAAHRIFNSF